jgi:hypothetical protein
VRKSVREEDVHPGGALLMSSQLSRRFCNSMKLASWSHRSAVMEQFQEFEDTE